jgi:long-chain fatty acid transport protein
MRKLLTFFGALLITGSLFAGGIVTNVNQSASWIRLPSRNASTNIDAVYYNPAGLMKLENGFHVSVSNQMISQTREVDNNYAGPGDAYGLNKSVYKGYAKAPLFPSLFAVYKMDKFAFSFGFGVVGGGGTATFDKGLPSFEMTQSDLVPLLATSKGVKNYLMNAYFEGKSAFFGYQGGVSYKINDFISIAVGLRYVTAKNEYEGYLKGIIVNPTIPSAPSSGFMRADSIMYQTSRSAGGAAVSTTNLISAGAGSLTFAQVQGAGYITAAQKAQLEGALLAFGGQTSYTVSQADAIFKGAKAKYFASGTLLGDQSADVTQSGAGFAPIISVNITPSENLNIAVKYEMLTTLKLKNKTKKDLLIGYQADGTPITQFPNGEETRNDMPALLSAGIDYKVTPNLKLSIGGNYYFDKSADYGHKYDNDLDGTTPTVHIANKDIIGTNGMSIQAGLEYNVTQKFLVSGGFILSNKGVNDKFQSDMNYYQASKTIGVGGAYNITEKIQLNLGVSTTLYTDATKTVDHMFQSVPAVNIQALETYKKNTIMGGIGLDFSF